MNNIAEEILKKIISGNIRINKYWEGLSDEELQYLKSLEKNENDLERKV